MLRFESTTFDQGASLRGVPGLTAHTTSILHANLRGHLTAVLNGSHTPQQVSEIVAVSHALAAAYVRSKVARGHLHPDRLGLSPSDIALDCIADLFRQDRDAGLIQITSYFGGIGIDDICDTELLGHLRRLIFSKVNQGLFRLYGEHDPGFGKILRNIKLSMHALHNFVELERFGETCIAPALCDTLEHLPSVSGEGLESALHQRAGGNEHIPGLLAVLALYLRTQSEHSRIVGLNVVASAFRSVYGRLQLTGAESVAPEDRLREQDSIKVIHDACAALQRKSHRRYVERKGIPEVVYQTYFRVIQTGLMQKYVDLDGADFSLFSSLQDHIPDMTRDLYHKEHRSVLEYLLSCTEKKVVEALKAD